jgi:glycosyltransferase involved in cell wall biosynthesis
MSEETTTIPHSSLLTPHSTIEVGVLTRGKPTLGMTLLSMITQETPAVRIHIVDTGETAVVRRDDVGAALRLAFDRGVQCSYERTRQAKRNFSAGRLTLLQNLTGPHIVLMDDDIVMPGLAFQRIRNYIATHPTYGYYAPYCLNIATPKAAFEELGENHYSPGGIIYQDARVRAALLDYYSNSLDVLDAGGGGVKTWDIAFLSALFPAMGRSAVVDHNHVVYHMDYQERPNWNLVQDSLIHASIRRAQELAAKYED